jgi:K+-sensing histidine kinase KdpD
MSKKRNVMVCVTQQKTCERLIKRGTVVRKYIKDSELYVFHVVNGSNKFLDSEKESNALEYLFSVTKVENGNMVVTRSENVLKSIIDFVKERDIAEIVIGEGAETEEDEDEAETFLNKLEQSLPGVNINIVEREIQD